MDPAQPPFTRDELHEVFRKYREMKHDINNTFAVLMALSELGQNSPAHLEKLAKAALDRIPGMVDKMNTFGETLGAPLKPEKPQAPAA